MDILCRLTRPGEVSLVERLPDSLMFGIREACFDIPSWSIPPDLLIDPNSREFLGVVFFLADDCTDVHDAFSETDPRMVKYDKLLPANWKEHYPYLTPKTNVLEIVWADRPTMKSWGASLSGGDSWYLADQGSGKPKAVLGLGILGMESILEEYGLGLPKELSAAVRNHP